MATGYRVDSALDNPDSFFTASKMNSRAAALNRLLDTMSIGTQTVEAADDGLSAITTLLETARATASEASQADLTVADGPPVHATVAGTGTLSPDAVATETGTQNVASETDFVANTPIKNDKKLKIKVDGITTDVKFGYDAGEVTTAADLEAAIDAIAGISASYDGSGQLVIVGDDTTQSFEIEAGTDDKIRDALGITEQVFDPTNLLTQGITAGETLTITVGGGSAETITFGTNDGAGEVDTLAELDAAISALTGDFSTQSLNLSNGGISLTATSGTDSITIGGSADVTKFGLSAGAIDPFQPTKPNPARESLRLDFNNLLEQIDKIAADSGINGTNLLAGSSLKVIFNETGTSSLTVAGISADSSGLGISTTATSAFDTDVLINAALAEIDAALNTLSTQSSLFGSKVSIVQIREDFTKALINTLETGADNLTLIDINEESATLLALQTRYQIAAEMLSITANNESQVLRLFD
jgi:flagellin-like hook-associated protein FlgL